MSNFRFQFHMVVFVASLVASYKREQFFRVKSGFLPAHHHCYTHSEKTVRHQGLDWHERVQCAPQSASFVQGLLSVDHPFSHDRCDLPYEIPVTPETQIVYVIINLSRNIGIAHIHEMWVAQGNVTILLMCVCHPGIIGLYSLRFSQKSLYYLLNDKVLFLKKPLHTS